MSQLKPRERQRNLVASQSTTVFFSSRSVPTEAPVATPAPCRSPSFCPFEPFRKQRKSESLSSRMDLRSLFSPHPFDAIGVCVVEDVLLPFDFQLCVFLVPEAVMTMYGDPQFIADGFELPIEELVRADTVGVGPCLRRELERLRIGLGCSSSQHGHAPRHDETTKHLFGIGLPEPVSRFFVKRSVVSDSPGDGRVSETVESLFVIFRRSKGSNVIRSRNLLRSVPLSSDGVTSSPLSPSPTPASAAKGPRCLIRSSFMMLPLLCCSEYSKVIRLVRGEGSRARSSKLS